MLKWTVASQRGGATATWRQTTVADESSPCYSEKPRRRRPSRMSGKHDKENSTCAVSSVIGRVNSPYTACPCNIIDRLPGRRPIAAQCNLFTFSPILIAARTQQVGITIHVVIKTK
jgi:hypothetical protein